MSPTHHGTIVAKLPTDVIHQFEASNVKAYNSPKRMNDDKYLHILFMYL